MKICFAIIYAGAAILAVGVVVYGDLITAGASALAVLMASVPTVLIIGYQADERINDLSQSNRLATTNFFVGRMREIEHEHAVEIQSLAVELGRTSQRSDDAESKIRRMTNRPKAHGRFVKVENTESEGRPIESDE